MRILHWLSSARQLAVRSDIGWTQLARSSGTDYEQKDPKRTHSKKHTGVFGVVLFIVLSHIHFGHVRWAILFIANAIFPCITAILLSVATTSLGSMAVLFR